jgi:5'-3' exonuclease
MGIPYYFYNIVKRNPKTVTFEPPPCKNIFFDFNSIIHQCSGKHDEILKYVLHVLEIIKPTNLIYIAVDGVAPRAKIQQQRKRRYLAALRKDPELTWDSNCITPGTEFMIELDTFLKGDFTKAIMEKYKTCIISSHEEAGEGEHKMMKYMNTNKIDQAVIYGLDADLIMLSLGAAADTKIHLMREINPESPDFRYLNIEMLKMSIEINVQDYIFLCFLLGNDFIPNVAFLKIKTNGIDILLQHYKKTSQPNVSLVQKDHINFTFLLKIIESLSTIEEESMSNALASPHWRVEYYKHILNGDSAYSHTFIRKVSMNYIEGLLWTYNYYNNDKYDQHWFYQYDYAPCVSDIYKYLITMDQKILTQHLYNLQKHSNEFISTRAQMVMVLPPQSKLLVPTNIRKLYDSLDYSCVHYFPIKFAVSTFMKSQAWEHIPILPIINLKTIEKALIECD